MGYIRPEEVTSPKGHLTLIGILDEGDQGQSALAIGLWAEKKRGHPDSRPVLLMRWNGYEDPEPGESRVGVPNSRGFATWFVVPEKYHDAILDSGLLEPDRVAFAREYLPEP